MFDEIPDVFYTSGVQGTTEVQSSYVHNRHELYFFFNIVVSVIAGKEI